MPTIVSKDQYFERALSILADSGFKDLNIRGMCTALGVTTGSFYHHFGSWKSFLAALLDYWERRQELILRDLRFGAGSADDDIAALRALALGLPHAAEASIRAWGMNDPMVRLAQNRVDAARYRTVRAAVARVVDNEESAETLAALGMSMLIGFQHLRADGEHCELDTLLDRYLHLVYLHSDDRGRAPAGLAARR